MKAFQVEGDFPMGRIRQHFVLQIVAPDDKAARDQAYALLGSRYGVNRRQVQMKSAKALKPDEVTDAVARHHLKG